MLAGHVNMAGPDKQFDRNATLDKALEVFWAKGFEATSMQDLVDNMGINRASMYQTYGNKRALFVAALARYIETMLGQMQEALAAPGSPLGNLHGLLQHFIEKGVEGRTYGCFINNTAVELGPHDAEIAGTIRGFWSRFESLLQSTLQRAIDTGELRPDMPVAQAAVLINIHLQGLMAKIKTHANREQVAEATGLLFDLIGKK